MVETHNTRSSCHNWWQIIPNFNTFNEIEIQLVFSYLVHPSTIMCNRAINQFSSKPSSWLLSNNFLKSYFNFLNRFLKFFNLQVFFGITDIFFFLGHMSVMKQTSFIIHCLKFSHSCHPNAQFSSTDFDLVHFVPKMRNSKRNIDLQNCKQLIICR